MNAQSSAEENRHLMRSLREAMRDPALSGGCFLLGELFAAIGEDDAAQPLLDAIPSWKLPGLLLSAAIVFRASSRPDHPLAAYLADERLPLDGEFRGAVHRTLAEEREDLADLVARHTYQCNTPRRMAVSLVAAAGETRGWPPALHVDIGTASGLGLLLGRVRLANEDFGPPDAPLAYPLEFRGAPPDLAGLAGPAIAESIGIDLDPPDLRDPDCRSWMRACQFPNPRELAYFDEAVALLLSQNVRIERGSATDLLPSLTARMPPTQPLIVTDTYVSVFMSEEDRERLRAELDDVARSRPVIWISNNPLVPIGPAPTRTTAGTTIPAELADRNQRELFGVVCVTTWPGGRRTPRIVGFNHPGACWLEWRPDFASEGNT